MSEACDTVNYYDISNNSFYFLLYLLKKMRVINSKSRFISLGDSEKYLHNKINFQKSHNDHKCKKWAKKDMNKCGLKE